MASFGPLAFLNPWLLTALIALPILWWLLRAIPPRPRREQFPGVRLLLGLVDAERTPDRTPWWLMALRCLLTAAVILAFADPVLNPTARLSGQGPVLLLMDGGWASAPDWADRRASGLGALAQAERAERPVAFHVLADPVGPEFRLDPRPAAEWRGRIERMTPRPWAPDRTGFADWLGGNKAEFGEAIWLHDGLAHGGEDGAGALAEALLAHGPLEMTGPAETAIALVPPVLRDGALQVTALRRDGASAPEVAQVAAYGAEEGEPERRLAAVELRFAPGAARGEGALDLPMELTRRISRLEIDGGGSAASVALADDSIRRLRVGLVSAETDRADRPLLSSLHYLRKALAPHAALTEGVIVDLVQMGADAIILADVAVLTSEESAALTTWVEDGGRLIRFAGPTLAAATLDDEFQGGLALDDPLLPVRIRPGGRDIGGALAWSQPRGLRAFAEDSPFRGLTPPAEVSITRQVLAEPDAELPKKTWAALTDGTPLVTADARGAGVIVLFHVTANAEWSSLPISGLFVTMMERIVTGSAGFGDAGVPEDLRDSEWRLARAVDGFGAIQPAPDPAPIAAGARLADLPPGPDAPPGLWTTEGAGAAIGIIDADSNLRGIAPAPSSASTGVLGQTAETALKAPLLALAAILLALDGVAALAAAGRLRRRRAHAPAPLSVALLAGAAALALLTPPESRAQALDEDAEAIYAASETVLAYVVTGDAKTDRMSRAGLSGLSAILTSRTAVEPAVPVGVNLETAELSLYPMLYWPMTEAQPTPSGEAAARLNAYMRTGGMIVIDTRDRNMGSDGPGRRALRRLVADLNLPPLAPVGESHVLTRAFYLLQDFPGRWRGGAVWVEAPPPPDALGRPQRPFSATTDGVSPVVIGDADWAAAWATDENGRFLAQVGRGPRQREMAFRFGVNLVMYVLTGNYKADQVHVPALLERLGN